MPGITTRMLVALGENGIKTVEDLAGCATDDLAGWSERKDGETTHNAGFLDGFDLTREECDAHAKHEPKRAPAPDDGAFHAG